MQISQIYQNYINSVENFNKFHNEVINMPRDHFCFEKLKQIRSIAAYILNIRDKLDDLGNNYKQILGFLIDNQRQNIFPDQKFRDFHFENNYLITNVSLNKVYKDKDKKHPEKGYLGVGRMFRHIMELCEFFGLVTSQSKQKKNISLYKCEQVVLAEEKDLIGLFRNYLLNTNIRTNTYIKNMFGVPAAANYQPTTCIMRYIKQMNRPVTTFEIALLLGRIDVLYDNDEVLKRAILVGQQFPQGIVEQQKFFFKQMGWVDSRREVYQYAASQQPQFKFNVYFLCMEQLGLLKRNDQLQTLELTEYANRLLCSSIPVEFSDLEQLSYDVGGALKNDADNDIESELIESLFRHDQNFKNRVLADNAFVVALNRHSLANVIRNAQGKKLRNKLVAEASKILANYTDQVDDTVVFKDRKGNYYCEAHHIIEFANEDGPDITDNLIVLNPTHHACIHRGSDEDVQAIYKTLRGKKVISKDLFLNMINTYDCLTKIHIRILLEKKIITQSEYEELYIIAK